MTAAEIARLVAEGLGLLAILGLGIRLRGKAPPRANRLRKPPPGAPKDGGPLR